MRKEGLKKDGSRNGTLDEIEIDSAAVAQPNDTNNLNGDAVEVDPFDGIDNIDNGVEVPKKKGKKAKESNTIIEVAVPTSTMDKDAKRNADGTEDADNGGDGGDGADENDDVSYEVEAIVSHKMERKKKLFLVRWKNYGPESDTWEAETSLSCPELIQKYFDDHPEAAKNDAAGKKRKAEKAEKPGKAAKKSVAKSKQKSPAAKTKAAKKDEEDYEVADIVDHKTERGKTLYLIRWKGYGPNSDTWEPEATLSCPDIIKKYKARTSKKPAASTSSKGGKRTTARGGKAPKYDEDDEEEEAEADYEVERIVDEKTQKGKKLYLVRWKGYTASSDTWEPESSVSCPDLIKKFHAEQNKKPAASKSGAGKNDKNKSAGKASKRKAATTEDDDEEAEDYEVEAIVDHKIEKGKKMYFVKWKGYASSTNTWEPESSLSCPDIVKKYLDIMSSSNKAAAGKSPKGKSSASKKKSGKDKTTKAKSTPNNKKSKKGKNKSADTDEDNDDDDEQEWEVEEVIDVKYNEDDTKEFLIRWKGCDSSQNTWEPESNLTCQNLIDKFMNKVDEVPKKKSRKS